MADLQKNMEKPDLDQVVNQKRDEESHSQEAAQDFVPFSLHLSDSSLADGYFHQHHEGSPKVQGDPKPTPPDGGEGALKSSKSKNFSDSSFADGHRRLHQHEGSSKVPGEDQTFYNKGCYWSK